jgi:hypothetical protein
MKIYDYEGPQAVPARPFGKDRLSMDKAFGNVEVKMKSGAKNLSWVLLHSYVILNFIIRLGRGGSIR